MATIFKKPVVEGGTRRRGHYRSICLHVIGFAIKEATPARGRDSHPLTALLC